MANQRALRPHLSQYPGAHDVQPVKEVSINTVGPPGPLGVTGGQELIVARIFGLIPVGFPPVYQPWLYLKTLFSVCQPLST